jgi:hypothetical protein
MQPHNSPSQNPGNGIKKSVPLFTSSSSNHWHSLPDGELRDVVKAEFKKALKSPHGLLAFLKKTESFLKIEADESLGGSRFCYEEIRYQYGRSLSRALVPIYHLEQKLFKIIKKTNPLDSSFKGFFSAWKQMNETGRTQTFDLLKECAEAAKPKANPHPSAAYIEAFGIPEKPDYTHHPVTKLLLLLESLKKPDASKLAAPPLNDPRSEISVIGAKPNIIAA